MTPASTARHFSYTHVENPSHSSLAMRFAFARLLASSATITQSLSLKRSLINIPKTEKTLHSSSSDIISKADYITGKLQDGFTVLLMTETKFGIILTLENNTNPFELLGNCRSCQENWMNRGHEKTRLCLEHENKITFYLLFHCS